MSYSPAPVFSSTVEVPHVDHGSSGVEHNSVVAAAAAAAAPPVDAVTHTSAPARLPDAFAVHDNSADPLLAGLQLAQERLAFYREQAAEDNFYHGGAVTSLLLPNDGLSSSPPPPPLRRDVVDVAASAGAALDLKANTKNGTGLGVLESEAVEEAKGKKRRKKKRHQGKTEKAEKPRHVSRRQREHARRIEVALSPALLIEIGARGPVAQIPGDVVVVESSSSTSSGGDSSRSSSTSNNGIPHKDHAAPGNPKGVRKASRTYAQKQQDQAQEEGAAGLKDDRGYVKKSTFMAGAEADRSKPRRRRRGSHQQQQQQQNETAAHRQPSTANLDAHLRDLPPAGNEALAAEAQQRTSDSRNADDDNNNNYNVDDGSDVDDRDYRPDDENASQLLEERIRLLQHGGDGYNPDDDMTHLLLTGYAKYVRPAEHFQRGPVPAWVQHYSDWLLFDAHRMDAADGTTLRKMLRAEEADALLLSGTGPSTWSYYLGRSSRGCCGPELRLQLPVDAVVLRLRGDIARARRMRAALLRQEEAATAFLHPTTYAGRFEVYNPTEPCWDVPKAACTDETGHRVGASAAGDDDVEMQATAAPPKLHDSSSTNVPVANYINSSDQPVDALHAEASEAVTVVVADADALDRTASKKGKKQNSKQRSPDSSDNAKALTHSPLLLSRELEAADLQRSLLAQTIPIWRRRGAAVHFLTELIQFLEDRLHAFGKQLDDPVLGPALELIGAPDSAGVDGTVAHTLPPALERAMRTTVTNTLLSDLFATERSAFSSRALRLSEALRRRQTPYVHDVYVTQLDGRPVYDYTAVSAARSNVLRYGGGPAFAGIEGGGSAGVGSGAGGAGAGDTRKSYSIHVDYVRFQPSLENSALSVLRRGGHHFAAVEAESAPDSHKSATAGVASRRSTLLSSSAEEPFSSVLLGSYISVFFPKEKPNVSASLSDPAAGHTAARSTSPQDSATDSKQQQSRHGSLGTDNIDHTTAALLLTLSTATSQNSLITFSPEEYLISLLLRYYEQYRMLQLNLLPSLKNRFFYREQLTQLQRQPRRTTELNTLQAQLEQLAETSANVERGCLHVMILLWNAVLEQRRRQRQGRNAADAQQQQGGQAGEDEGYDASADEDPPIIIQHRASVVQHQQQQQQQQGQKQERANSKSKSTHNHTSPPRGAHVSPPPPMTPQELRQHPPLFAGEDNDENDPGAGVAGQGHTPAPVVHSVNNTITYNEKNTPPPSASASSSTNSKSDGSAPLPLPLFFSPNSPDARAASASASPLLAPASVVSTDTPQPPNNADKSNSDQKQNSGAFGENEEENGGVLDDPQQLTYFTPPATRFRFFLRRYGTTEEVPYTMGDDLLWYAAEVEGTDVVSTPVQAAAAAAATANWGNVHSSAPAPKPAGKQTKSTTSSADDLLYFQLVVFTRSNAAMVPQYVGCTAPRPMTTSKVIFFNETFEVRALHEPAEMLLHLIPVTAGASKMTVVSTVRLRPTLTRRYTLLPLQPPTAFMFHGKLFTRNTNTNNSSSGKGVGAGRSSTLAATPLSGVLAVSTTWTSSQGLTVPQMERLFLRSCSGGGADPMDPQYRPLLRALRGYYAEQASTRAAAATDTRGAGGDRTRAQSRGRRERRGAAAPAVGELKNRHRDHHLTRGVPPTGLAASATTPASAGGLNRHASSLAVLRQRHASASLQRQLTTLGPSALFNAAAAARTSSFRYSTADTVGPLLTNSHALAGGGGGENYNSSNANGALLNTGAAAASLTLSAHTTPMMVLAAAAGAHDYAVEEVQQRLPTARLQCLFRRWLVRMGRIKPADEVESRLLQRPIPLHDAEMYLARKRVLRLVEAEDDARNKAYSACGARFDAERYYKAPSAISGLALSNLPRETKLQLWQERQRRLLLTLKANRHVTDAEKLETIVKVPKMAVMKMFDFTPRSQLNPHRKERPKTEDIDRALLKRRQDSHIVIHIMKAHNLPYRADGTPLEPFVQASFVSEAAYTRSEVGSSPSWFQTLELPFQPLDFEEDTLSMIDDDIVIALYDKVEVKMAPSAATTAAVAHETHYRTERRFIGTLRIPFYSLHQAQEARMEGVYPLRTPRWLLGYDLLNTNEDAGNANVLQSYNNNGSAAAAGGGASMGVAATVPVAMSVTPAAGAAGVSQTQSNNNNKSSTYTTYNHLYYNKTNTASLSAGEALKENPFGAVDDGSGGAHPFGGASVSFAPSATADTAASVFGATSAGGGSVVRATTATLATSSGVQEQHTIEPTIQLYLSLWPPLQRDPPKKLTKTELQRSVSALYVSPELHYLHRVALQWQQRAQQRAKSIAALNAQATTRQIDPFVECSTGDLVLVCRYMLPRGGPPPPSVRTIFEAIRYVSLLPFVADMMSFGEKDVWSTNAELLAMRSGDYEELALLLVHFLRYLAPARPTYAVVGSGSVYQQTILVLHEFEDKELYLIDPRSGWTVPAGRPYGTLLRDVYLVISHDQLWANTQMSGLPHRMTWDLHNPTHWLPCFDCVKDRRISACLPHLFPIQREVLEFPPADPVKSREIEIELRACLKRALLMWRNGCPPAYHRGVEGILRELLVSAEAERCTCGSARRTDLTSSAAARLSEYFGESVTGGDPKSFMAGQQQQQDGRTPKNQKKHRKRHHSRQRSPAADTRRGKEGEKEEEEEEDNRTKRLDGDAQGESGANSGRHVEWPLSSSASLRVLGSPVMGSYNPADPQFEEVLQQVFEGAVHEVGTNEVSFAAGIYVKSYTGDVCAMWVFLVAICRG